MNDDLPTTASLRQRTSAAIVTLIFVAYSLGPLIVQVTR